MQFEGIGQAAKAVTEFYILNKEAMPSHIVERLDGNIGMSRSPVDAVVRFTEAAYANLDGELPEGMAELAAGCALLCEEMGYHDFGEADERGSKIARALLGKKVTKAPDAKGEFVPAGEPYSGPPPIPDQPPPLPEPEPDPSMVAGD